ncbi:MAG: IclR family transcriptional regulator [Dehalococcoidia bacterium]|nr:IclR family transcriptional regulator [Dehalococcoidia bacterium]
MPLLVVKSAQFTVERNGIALSGIAGENNLRLISRAFALLELLGNGGGGISVASLASGLPKGTVHRILRTLVALGYVRQEPNGKYVLTTKLYQVGRHAVYSIDIRKVARPHLERLAAETMETVVLGILDGPDAVLLDKVDAPRDMALAIAARLGGRAPAYCTAIGKAMLAHFTDEKLAKVIDQTRFAPVTSHTISTLNELMQQLDQVRRDGYAISNEELHEGIVSVAAPLKDYDGEVVAGINVSISSFRLHEERLAQVAQLVKQTAREISQGLGAADRT